MKKIIYTLSFVCLFVLSSHAENADSLNYRRSSIYSIMIKHKNQKFCDEISDVFKKMPVPDKYNNHDLSVKIVSVSEKKIAQTAVNSFLEQNRIGSRLISKWFNRDFTTGSCDMELIKERGLYNASEFDKALAEKSVRGKALLEDAGEDLIGNTFVLVNDISYIDKANTGKALGAIFKGLGYIAAAATSDMSYASLGENTGNIAETLKGFKVKIYTHLYQLVWDEETQYLFYNDLYTAAADLNKLKKLPAHQNKFKLKYIGSQLSDGSTTSFMGIKLDEPEQMIRKACQRALDDNVANLQKNYEVFKVKTPLLKTEPICAAIGRKEGILPKSKFEVLEVIEDKNGKVTYKRVGVIQPMPNLIWDNRYMAIEENAYGANFKYTTFKKISGRDFYPGMLIREIK